ncbi:uncharacterized protein B0H18DRAFT_1123681 [Fomitopsis serialis]|uniref:uncharacterized protein n=1 Tax=Fomitopsis serialis TaxID=139415 RepID=UPI00200723FE|nr:uncharacterized protein B0H18DRAFT_1123681 [Neoantrodia serialis]KAH9917343.1 hypothetical protein B0H18DRAFT_1123681 [Neoantrodia serialis]
MKFTSAIFLSAAALFHAACAVPLGEIDGQLSGRASNTYDVTDDVVKRTGGEVYITSPDALEKRIGGDLYIPTSDVVKRTGGEAYIVSGDVVRKREGGATAYNELDESL